MNILKKISVWFMGIIFAMSGLLGSVNAQESAKSKKKVAIVYFSHTGNTKIIAEKVQEALENEYEVDIFRIEAEDDYPEYGDELRDKAKKEADDDNFRPNLKELKFDAQKYDAVLVGSPVWWYKTTKAVDTFLEKQNFAGKIVCFFITHAGGPGDSPEDMQNICKGAIFGPNVDIYCNSPGNGEVDCSKVNPWIDEVKQKLN